MISPQAVLLAAGQSTHFNGNKLLARINESETLLDRCCNNIFTHASELLVVISDDSSMQQHCHNKNYDFICNPRSKDGIGTSIACAVAATAGAAGWMIFLADMPCITTEIVNILQQKWRGDNVVAPVYRQQRGHPVLFPATYRDKLLNLQADEGARRLLIDNPDLLVVEVDHMGVVIDIDTPEAMQAFRTNGCDNHQRRLFSSLTLGARCPR
jgi:molybdenum cofactor cytidylyltransferase